MKKHQFIAASLIIAAFSFFSSGAWADADEKMNTGGFADRNEMDRGYTNKSYHEGELHTYKHPGQRSFTSPFDYAPCVEQPVPTTRAILKFLQSLQ